MNKKLINKKLKAKIIERFGYQFTFAQLLQVHESVVSEVVRGWRRLSPEQKEKWCALLDCDQNIFAEGRQ